MELQEFNPAKQWEKDLTALPRGLTWLLFAGCFHYLLADPFC
jgi:hypothetical protein